MIQQDIIYIDEQPIPYFLRQSKRAKRLQLSVKESGIELIVPIGVKPVAVQAFLQASRHWIRRQHSILTEFKYCFWPTKLLPGEQISIEGRPYRIQVKYAVGQAPQRLSDCIVVPINNDSDIGVIQQQHIERQIQINIVAMLKSLAQRRVEDYMQEICTQLQRWPRQIKVKQQKRRWGSCTARDDIYINWTLILAPVFVLKYVVLHECCHLIHKNHGSRFWNKVALLMPEYEKAEQWLKQYGRYLSAPEK